ncbi:MAG TPA: hypothetical protein VHX86_06505 [Tepidisphaeraceae bacterium]|nr:hypothetical protein [Tepidisphaeraceae bacterium]
MVRKNTFLAIAGLAVAAASPAWANPLAGEVLKFQQLPLGDLVTNPNSVFPGHDELSTASALATVNGYSGTFAADDFSDNVTSPVVDVQWWGSYLPNSGAPNQIKQFLISFESDIPAGPAGNFSEPGQVLSSEVVTLAGTLAAGAGDFTEQPEPSVPGPDGPLYEYNAELATPFPEQAGVVYWLKIVALTGPNDPTQWGWHNRDYSIVDPYAAAPGDSILGTNAIGQPVFHYLDDAVTGNITFIPGSPNLLREGTQGPLDYNPITDGFAAGAVGPSEDLAFGLYYVPEPVGLPLLAAGLFLLRRQRRSA